MKNNCNIKILKPTTRAEWLKLRTCGIGSSEVATIMGLNPYESAYSLWERKRGGETTEDNKEVFVRGHIMEQGVAELFCYDSGYKIVKSSAGDWIAQSKAKPYMQASPDRIYKVGKEERICECKTCSTTIDPEDIPPYWYCQLQYQLHITGLKMGALAWLSSVGWQHGYKEIEYNPEFGQYIENRVTEFWNDYIHGDKVPPITTPADVKKAYPVPTQGKSITNIKACSACFDNRQLKAELKRIEKQIEANEDAIKMVLQDAEYLTNEEGEIVASWKTTKPVSRFDTQRFKAEQPELAEQYTTTKEGNRVLKIR